MSAAEEEDLNIEEEYKIWKTNSQILYDYGLQETLTWPSLTVQWLPKPVVEASSATHNRYQMLLGTQTDGSDNNYLMLAEIALPTSEHAMVFDDEFDRAQEGGFGRALAKNSLFPVSTAPKKKTFQVMKKIVHEGEVNRARYMHQNTNIVATKSPNATVHVFDLSQHNAEPADSTFHPQHRLHGHEEEGYGISWNSFNAGHLLSASTDKSICLWDINEASVDVKAVNTWKSAHSAAVEDVDWSRFNANVFASVGDDSQLLLWDIKSNAEKPIQGVRAHDSDVNCVAFNPYDEYTLVTGGSDNAVKLWDIRKLVQPMHTMEGHEEGVYQVSWSTVKKNLLASSSEDRRVYVWDLNRIGREQSAEDAEDGPPELLYVHGGHTAKVFDFSWHPSEPWYIASVAEDNVLQVWQMSEAVYNEEEEEGDEGIDDDDLEEDDEDDEDGDEDGEGNEEDNVEGGDENARKKQKTT